MFKFRFYILFLGVVFSLSQVDLRNVSYTSAPVNLAISTPQFQSNSFDAATFYKKQCGFCHTKEEMIGPDMNKIKAVYLKKYPKKEDFIKAVSDFVANPDKKSAIYKDGIDNFMDMPKMPFKTDEIKAVAAYIYNTITFK